MRPRQLGCLVFASIALPLSAGAQSVEALRAMSIDDLANIQISSVSKAPEPLSEAPAAIYVISHDDIIAAGATTVPEMLRLAPNLEVAQLNATSYAITARGFNTGINASLSNKLLVLIDGRSVYTPLFGGVYWDMQQVPPDDVDRIEVISGPGATLWGANAVNGVINIITRRASQTPGGLLTLGGGNLERSASLQYGGTLAPNLTYRVHAEGYDFSPYQTPTGHGAGDGWTKPQGGFRLDWTPHDDRVSLQGDLYEAQEDPAGVVAGQDLVASWDHTLAGGGSLQVLGYYDRAARSENGGGSSFVIATYDIEVQHSTTIAGWNSIVSGIGERAIDYRFHNTALQLVPDRRRLNLANVFSQDTISLTDRLKLTLGLKLEEEPYANLQWMPSVRASFKATPNVLLWGAVSRAVRSPTPVDEDLREFAGALDALNGSSSFRPEDLIAYELGTRIQLIAKASFSVSTFYNVYDDLRSIEPNATTGFFPLAFANKVAARAYGVEVWGNYQAAPWWRLTAGFNLQHEDLRFTDGSSRIGGFPFVADDPNHQASLRSAIDFGGGVTWDAAVRYVGSLPHPALRDYGELNMRLGWAVTPTFDVSAAGFNLLHPRHAEFVEGGETDQIPRSYYLQTRLRF